MLKSKGRGNAPLTFVPGNRGIHSLSLAQKVNAPLKPEWGGEGAGVSNDWCIKSVKTNCESKIVKNWKHCHKQCCKKASQL